MAVMLPCGAHAASITNMADIPYDIQAVIAGTEQAISIEPGATWHSEAYPIQVLVKSKRVTLEASGEYTIWKDGSFTQQKRGAVDRHK